MDGIEMVKGEYRYRDRAGILSPLRYQENAAVLLRNSERFIQGEVSPVEYQEVYESCVELERLARGLNQEDAA